VSSQYFRINAGGEQSRSVLFEQLLARAECRTSMADWRTEAFSCVAPPGMAMPPVAAAALYADRGSVESAWVCLATPVHYVAEMSTVRLPNDGILSLPPAAAAALALDFNRVWQGAGMSLTAARSGQLFCLFDRRVEAATRDPREALGQSIEEYLPAGEGSATLRKLLSETEMWLFQHGLNEARNKSGEPQVSGLWLWGGGTPLAVLPPLQGWVGGSDDFFDAFGARADARPGSGVVTIDGAPGGPQWQDIESRWFRPALAEMHSGDLSSLELSIKHWRFTLNSRTLRRFWRRRKPWWEFLA
jgi:hypothetical protein